MHPSENNTGTIRGDNHSISESESRSISESQSGTQSQNQNESEIGDDSISESQNNIQRQSQNGGEIGGDSQTGEEGKIGGDETTESHIAKLKPVRKLIELFRTGEEDVLLTTPGAEKQVTLTTSALESIVQQPSEEVIDPDANAKCQRQERSKDERERSERSDWQGATADARQEGLDARNEKRTDGRTTSERDKNIHIPEAEDESGRVIQ